MTRNVFSYLTLTLMIFSANIFAASKIRLTLDQSNKLLSKKTHRKSSTKRKLANLINGEKDFALKLVKVNKDSKGLIHKRYIQTYKGIPLFGEQIISHESYGEINNITGNYYKNINKDLVSKNSLVPSFSRIQALEMAKEISKEKLKSTAQWNYKNEKSELVIYIDNDIAKLAYFVNFLGSSNKHVEPTRPHFIIDAKNKQVLKFYEGLAHRADAGTGPGGNEKIGRYVYGQDFDALEVTRSGDNCTMETDKVKSVNLNHTSSGSTAYSYTCPENTFQEINGAYSPINDVHFFGVAVFRMYKEWLQTEPLPFQLTLKVHYGTDYENAFWDGSAMTFGDGASRFYPLVDMNVTAHEVSHGFTEFNSGLIYSAQSGGMNEAFSDMAGEAGEYFLNGTVDWGVGSGIFKSEGSLRYFEDPTKDGKSIGHADDYTSSLNVHYSSGVYNRAFYLLSNTNGWNPKKAFEVFVRANQNYWTPNSTFEEGACGTILAGVDSGYNWQEINAAFKTVGVECIDLPIDDDQDGMRDSWEIKYGLNPRDPSDASLDNDNDGLTNIEEFKNHTDPTNNDSDNDGLSDGAEVYNHHTLPNNSDTDGDEMFDGYEVNNRLDPKSKADRDTDADGDGFSNFEEFKLGTDPQDGSSFPVAISSYQESFDNGIPATNWVNTPGSDEDWMTDAAERTSIRSGITGDGEVSTISFSGYFTDGALSFDSRVSSEANYDKLIVTIDGKIVLTRSGERDWMNSVIELARGFHTINFSFEKDSSDSRGRDTAWIDEVVFTGN